MSRVMCWLLGRRRLGRRDDQNGVNDGGLVMVGEQMVLFSGLLRDAVPEMRCEWEICVCEKSKGLYTK